MLKADEITVSYGPRRVLDQVSFKAEAQSLLIIVGPNGAGKSTLMRALTGELTPQSGTVTLHGKQLTDIPSDRLARLRAVLPQSSSLAFPFTVHEIIRFGLTANPTLRSGDRVRDVVEAMLDKVDLRGYGGRYFQELSGGEQQRVHLARVLCQVPNPVEDGTARFLMLDEPTSSLDIRHQLLTLNIARQFAADGGGVIAILHDLNIAAMFADRIVVISDGQIVANGTPQKVLTDKLMRDVFEINVKVSKAPSGKIPFVLPQTIQL